MKAPSTTNLDAILHDRLMKFGQFIAQWGEYGKQQPRTRRLQGMTYSYAINAGRNLVRQATADYKQLAAGEIRKYLQEERISDMSLIIDELFDAENLEEILEKVKEVKKVAP